MKICPTCACVLPEIGSHDCHPKDRTISLTLTRMESNFLAWSQAYACATLSGNKKLGLDAFKHVHAYAQQLGVPAINDLGDRHTLLARAAWPDIKLREMDYDEGLEPPTPGVSQ